MPRSTTTAAMLALLAAVLTACRPAPDPLVIDLVGDSLTVQAHWDRDAEFTAGAPVGATVRIDAWLGNRFAHVQEREAARVATSPAPGVLVIALGVNDAAAGWPSSARADFARLLNTPHPDACVVVLPPAVGPTAGAQLRAATAAARNDMAAEASTRGRTVIATWPATVTRRPSVLGPDGVHLAESKEARAAYAAVIWAAVEVCQR